MNIFNNNEYYNQLLTRINSFRERRKVDIIYINKYFWSQHITNIHGMCYVYGIPLMHCDKLKRSTILYINDEINMSCKECGGKGFIFTPGVHILGGKSFITCQKCDGWGVKNIIKNKRFKPLGR